MVDIAKVHKAEEFNKEKREKYVMTEYACASVCSLEREPRKEIWIGPEIAFSINILHCHYQLCL